MSNKRSKKIRRLMMAMPEPVLRAAAEDGKDSMLEINTRGERQHARINIVRQMKSKITAALDMRVPENRKKRAELERLARK